METKLIIKKISLLKILNSKFNIQFSKVIFDNLKTWKFTPEIRNALCAFLLQYAN